MSRMPDLNEWLQLPLADMAALVRERRLSVKIAVDGSRRHFLLKHPTPDGEVGDFEIYARIGFDDILKMIGVLFSCGFETVIILNVWPPDIERREDYVRQAVRGTWELVLGAHALESYKAWDARVRLNGNYDVSPVWEAFRADMLKIGQVLEEKTAGSQLLLWGYCAGNGLDEVITRAAVLYQQLGRIPSEQEVRTACFPNGPESLDVYIGSGWLLAGNASLPPILNAGNTDAYFLSHLPLDLTIDEVRHILFDKLFLRPAVALTDNLKYRGESLESLRTYYDEHSDCVVGLGHLVGPGLWYPDHVHPAFE